MIDYWPLLGIALVVLGFALRFNPLLVVAVAAIVTGPSWRNGFPEGPRGASGRAFNENRYVSIIYLVLPVIGLLERYGLQQRARTMIVQLRGRDDRSIARSAILLSARSWPRSGLIAVGGHAADGAPAGRADGRSGGREGSTASSTKQPPTG